MYESEELGIDLNNTVYAFDSTTIDLCLATFPWARFRAGKGAVKMHTLPDPRGDIPNFVHISDGKMHDGHALDLLPVQAGAIYVMDRGYVDFPHLFGLHQPGAFFVTRAKSNLDARRISSALVDRTTGLICDQTVALMVYQSSQNYPDRVRRIRFRDPLTAKTLIFLTKDFELSAAIVCALYKSRWQVEPFFKCIKQHLHIRRFFGTSENAVKTQI